MDGWIQITIKVSTLYQIKSNLEYIVTNVSVCVRPKTLLFLLLFVFLNHCSKRGTLSIPFVLLFKSFSILIILVHIQIVLRN